MDISFIGHSSFRLKGKSASLVTDPFDPKMVGLKYPKVSADIVTVSHEHKDHNREDLVKDVKRVVSGPGEYEILGVSILGFNTFHDDKKGEERGKNTIYLINMDDINILHLGDLGHKLSEDLMDQIGDVDILMIPVGGVYTIGPSDAAEISRKIEPSIIIPMHYQMKGLKPDVFSNLEKEEPFLSELSLPVEKTDKLTVKRASLEEENKIVVLSKKD